MQRIQKLRRIVSGDAREISRFVIDAADAFNRLVSDLLLNRQTITVNIGTSATEVAHALQRQPKGWFIISNNANAVVWNAQPPSTQKLTLQASASCSITIEVY